MKLKLDQKTGPPLVLNYEMEDKFIIPCIGSMWTSRMIVSSLGWWTHDVFCPLQSSRADTLEVVESAQSRWTPNFHCYNSYNVCIFIYWLVLWNLNFIFPYIGNNHPNWLSYFSRWLKPPTRLFQVCEFIHWPAFFFYDWWFIPGLTTWWPVLRSLEYLDLQMIFYKFSMGNPLQYRESIGNIFCFLVVPQANPWIGISFNTPARAATEW